MSTTVTSTATFGMDAFASLAVVPSASDTRGTITFTSAAPNSRVPSFSAKLQAKEFGPFLAPMTVSIVVEDGSCTYQLTGNTGGYQYDSSGNVTGLVGPDGTAYPLLITHPRYFTHLFAGSQLSDDDKVYDISGAQGHATRETDLTVSALWTTVAGYASSLDTAAVDGQRLRRLALPSLNWDWLGGESLFIWWLGKCTAEGSTTNLMGNARGVAGENGFRVRVAATGQMALTMTEGTTIVDTFSNTTLLPFDGSLHSFGLWFNGQARLGYSWVDETIQVGGTPLELGDMLPTSAQVSAGTDKLILGGDSLLTGSATSSIAQSTRALVILKLAATDSLPTTEQVRQAMIQLRAAPYRVLAQGAL